MLPYRTIEGSDPRFGHLSSVAVLQSVTYVLPYINNGKIKSEASGPSMPIRALERLLEEKTISTQRVSLQIGP